MADSHAMVVGVWAGAFSYEQECFRVFVAFSSTAETARTLFTSTNCEEIRRGLGMLTLCAINMIARTGGVGGGGRKDDTCDYSLVVDGK